MTFEIVVGGWDGCHEEETNGEIKSGQVLNVAGKMTEVSVVFTFIEGLTR